LTGAWFPANLLFLRQPSEAETFFAGGRSGFVTPHALRKSGQRRKAVIVEHRSSNEPHYL